MENIKVSEKIFNSEITVVMGDYKAVMSLVKKNHPDAKIDWGNNDDSMDDGNVITIGLKSYIWFNKFEGTETQCYSTIFHECGHVAFEVLRYMNFTVDEAEKEEIFLYLQQFYFIEIANKINKFFPKKKKV